MIALILYITGWCVFVWFGARLVGQIIRDEVMEAENKSDEEV